MAEEYEYRSAWEIARALGLGNPEKIDDPAEKKRFKNELGGRILQVLRNRGYLVGQNMLTEKGMRIGKANMGKGKASGRVVLSWKFNETVALLDDIRPATRAEMTALKDEMATLRRELLAAIDALTRVSPERATEGR